MRSATGTERAENSHGAAECASGARGSGGSGPRRARRARGTRKLAPKGGRGGSRSWRRFRPACSFCGVLVLRRARSATDSWRGEPAGLRGSSTAPTEATDGQRATPCDSGRSSTARAVRPPLTLRGGPQSSTRCCL